MQLENFARLINSGATRWMYELETVYNACLGVKGYKINLNRPTIDLINMIKIIQNCFACE